MINEIEKNTNLPSQKNRKGKVEKNKDTLEKKKNNNVVKKVKVFLNGRSGPGKTYDVVKVYQPDTKLTIIEEKNGWAKNSENIYVMSQYLK